MRKVAIGLVLAGFVAGGIWLQTSSRAGEKTPDNLAHMVYFKLKDSSPKAVSALVDGCKKHLSGHDGTVYFSAGVLAQDLKRDVNDRDFDVGLHLVFKDMDSYNKYAKHPRHDDFIAEGKANWEKVRVFDTYVSAK